MLATARTFLSIELGTLNSDHPDDATLDAVAGPVHLLVSEPSAPLYVEVANWLARRLGDELSRTPRADTARNGHLEELAQTIRPLLTRVSASAGARP